MLRKLGAIPSSTSHPCPVTITGFPSARHLTFDSLILQVLDRSRHGHRLCDLLSSSTCSPINLQSFFFLFLTQSTN